RDLILQLSKSSIYSTKPRLRHKARQQGIHLPVRAIFGKGLAFIS
ncbi:TPA: DNA-binding response regulator, partial [Klebsiella pneumoniae]|nr:DNA-binding response regulator [Klebsiella pneumoniae]HBX3309367.1 DNA-binding response regulator [Klebsiella pneumoniae]HBX3346455.1 DNA-binding response regulator [Klebsiella pneumoniae]HBX3372688.1 DNA-binding response regulator [Klebsiella pneumoniae]